MKQKKLDGQSLIEFALLLPIAIFLVVGFFDLGRAIFYYSSLTNVVREGARYGIVDTKSKTGPYADIIDEINGYSFGIPNVNKEAKDEEGNDDACCCYPGPCYFYSSDGDLIIMIERLTEAEFFDPEDTNLDNENNAYIRVKGTYTFEPVTPFIERIFGNSTGIDLVAKSSMRISSNARD